MLRSSEWLLAHCYKVATVFQSVDIKHCLVVSSSQKHPMVFCDPVPIAQTVEHGTSNPEVMDLIPRECLN